MTPGGPCVTPYECSYKNGAPLLHKLSCECSCKCSPLVTERSLYLGLYPTTFVVGSIVLNKESTLIRQQYMSSHLTLKLKVCTVQPIPYEQCYSW